MRNTQTAAKISPAMHMHVIHPTAIYFPEDVRTILKLKTSTLRREIRAGRLCVCKRAGRYFFLGRQLLDWLSAGELSRKPGSNGTTPR